MEKRNFIALKKAITSLLLGCIVFLMVQPVAAQIASYFGEDNACTMSCCSVPMKHKGSKPNDCCPKGICNPFAACAYCLGYPVASPLTISSPTLLEEKEKLPAESQNGIGQYLSACWHPPEVV